MIFPIVFTLVGLLAVMYIWPISLLKTDSISVEDESQTCSLRTCPMRAEELYAFDSFQADGVWSIHQANVDADATCSCTDPDSDSGSDSGSEIIDKSITITKKENYNIHLNFKNLSLNDQAYIESVAMNKRTNVKTVITYLDNFNAHLISERQIKSDIIDYQRHYKRWLNLQQIQTIKEKAVNPYKNNLVGVKPLKK